MFDTYLFVQYDYTLQSGEEGQIPHRKVRNVFPVERSELSYVERADPDVLCVFHRDERMTGKPTDPCPRCQVPMQAVAYRLTRGKLVIFVVEGELAITNPALDIQEMFEEGQEAAASFPVSAVAAAKPKRSRSKPRAKSPVPVAEEAATPDAVPAEAGGS